ncbi:MAG: metal dependent phosphohydrolase [Holophagaceae bacterium]|nr:metal dependent phosphohydrolase [Holophagaceae bacterium]
MGLPGEGRFAECGVWPGEEGAFALVEAGHQRLRDQRDMERLHEIGRALASEHNLDRLLDLILTQARRLLGAEGGSIYLVVSGSGSKELLFAHTQNSSVSLPFHRYRMPISTQSMAGFVATTGECLNLPDVYRIPEEAPYRFNDAFDRQAGYRSASMLVVPLQDTEGEVLGVLQLINRVEEDGGEREIVPFLSQHVRLAQSLAGQAGVAVKNASLREEIERLFEGFVNASVLAIEQRDPVTSGHSGRVAALTVGLAEAINSTPDGPFGEVHFTDRQIRELRYASLLHDFGKVGVREQVLVKSKKLEPGRLEVLLHRLRQRQEERMLEALQAQWAAGQPFRRDYWEEVQRGFQEETDRLIAMLQQSNEPTVLTQEVAKGLGTLDGLRYTHWDGAVEPIFLPQDLACLAIPKGSLSEEERLEIESHVTHTYRFLQQIPWTRDLSDVPDIAYAHHERLNGRGYPRQIAAPDIPLQSRAMAIADVFDALTAQDRPYKAAVPLERSLAILELDAVAGHLDPELLRLFVEAKVYEATVRRY